MDLGHDTSRIQPLTRADAFDTSHSITTGLRKLARRFVNAIRAEEAAINERGGSQLPVRAVVPVVAGGGEHLYDVTLTKARKHLREGSSVTVVDGRQEHEARVIRASGTHLRLVVSEPITSQSDQVRLRTDSAWLWRAVRNRLSNDFITGDRRKPSDSLLCCDLIASLLRAMRSGRKEPVPPVASATTTLNPGQLTAFREALRNAIYFVWGPPGTGKTTVLASITEALVRARRTVLYVATSNAAADIATEKIVQLLARHPDIDRGLVLRYGRGAGHHLLGAWGSRVIPDRVFERLAAEALLPPAADPDSLRTRLSRLEPALASAGNCADHLLRETSRRLLRRMRLQINAGTDAADNLGLATCRVVITTAHNLVLSPALRKRYDTVIIDEASQMPLPLVLIAASHAEHGVIVGGDPQQLPPVVESRKPWVKQILGQDIFRFAGVNEASELAACTMLVEQYRMSPPISTLVSRLAYSGRLEPHESVSARRVSTFRRRFGALTFIDTSEYGSVVTTSLQGSRENITHVRIATRALHDLRSRSLVNPSQSVAVVSPFAAQASQLQSSVGTAAEVSTVHAYQGAEVDFLVLDLTDAHGANVSRFLQAESAEDEGGRLLTVALSRAREGIVLIADFSFLETNGGTYVRRLLAHMRHAGRPLPLNSSETVMRGASRVRRVG